LFATQARVDELSSQVKMIKEDVNALITTSAKLLYGQRRIETRVKRLEAGQQRLENKFGQLDTKVGQLDTKVEQVDTKVEQLDTWVRDNLRAVMSHLGVPEVETADEQ